MTVTWNLHYGLAAWSNHTFTLAERCSNGGEAYHCTTAGSSTAAPTGTGTGINNGGAAVFKWLSHIDYSDPMTMIAAMPTPITQPYILLLWNDGEITSTAAWGFSSALGSTATNYIEMKPATGEAWNDNPNVRTNAFMYNPANGVAIKSTNAYNIAISSSAPATYIRDIQLFIATGIQDGLIFNSDSTDVFQLDRCILYTWNHHPAKWATGYIPPGGGGDPKIRDCLYILDSYGGRAFSTYRNGGFYSCTVVGPSDAPINDLFFLHGYGGTGIANNCALYGITGGTINSGSWAYTNCRTDMASPPTGVTQTTPYTSQFEGSVYGSWDLRLKTGSGLINAGADDGSGLATDATKLSRPQGSAWDVGAWEVAAAAAYRARIVRWQR